MLSNKWKNCVILIFLPLLLANLPTVFADKGLVAPPHIALEEPGQIAIVAWNGKEEVLILSTNVKSSKSTIVLEVLPLPSNPTRVAEGSFESFIRLNELINKKLLTVKGYGIQAGLRGEEQGIEVTFHEKIGLHDVTVVKVNNLNDFTEWVADFTQSKGLEYVLSSEFKNTVSDYLESGIKFFVFDVIEANENVQSIKPLIYKFETNFLYYPLKVTATSDVSKSTYSAVNLFLIAKGQISKTSIRSKNLLPRLGFDSLVELSREELYEISPELADLFEGDPLVMNSYYHGPLGNLKEDVVVYGKDLRTPTFLERTLLFSYLYYYWNPPSGFLFCFVVGVPASIFLVAKSVRRFVRKLRLRTLTQTMISYSLSIGLISLLLFSGIKEVVGISMFSLILLGLAAIIITPLILLTKH